METASFQELKEGLKTRYVNVRLLGYLDSCFPRIVHLANKIEIWFLSRYHSLSQANILQLHMNQNIYRWSRTKK
jgi:hypothetical protein